MKGAHSVYAPNQRADTLGFLCVLMDEVQKHGQEQLIIGGDWNYITDFTMD